MLAAFNCSATNNGYPPVDDSARSTRHLKASKSKSQPTMSPGSTPSTTFAKFFEQFRRPQKQRSLSQPELPAAVDLHSKANEPSLERRKTVDGGIQPLRGEDRKEDRYLSGILAAVSGI